MILVTGFGPFPGVSKNPSAALARALDGARVAGETVVGEVLPVSYARGPARTCELARHRHASLVLGLGVAARRRAPKLERWARRLTDPDVPDVDGIRGPQLPAGPPRVRASLDIEVMAEAMGCGVSEDAGRYVCNAWLYVVSLELASTPVGFLHVPAVGMEPSQVLEGLKALI